MENQELIVDEECLPVATATVRSPEALAEFYERTDGPLRWSAEYREESDSRYLNTYDIYRKDANGDGVIRLTLTETVIIETADGALREIVADQPARRSAVEGFPDDSRENRGLDLFCAFLAQFADSFNETLVKPYLAAKRVMLEDGQQGVLRDNGTLKFLLVTDADGDQVEEVRLFGIDLVSVEREETEAAVDRASAFDGYRDFLSIRPPIQLDTAIVAGISLESHPISEKVDADTLDEPEPEEVTSRLEALAEAAPVAGELATFEESDFVPPFFMTSRKVLAQADPIPDPGAIESAGGRIRGVQHPNNANACLRMIQLPPNLKATRAAAEVLAGSGTIQTGDVLLSFRPQWSRTNAYGNIQLGLSHTALALIDPRGGEPVVHTIESPINYSSHLNYNGHYRDLDYIHIVRPALTPEQKLNLRKWAFQILTRRQGNIEFFGNYGSPYFSRETPHQDPISISKKLARVVTTGSGNLAAYCSEFVWALLGLRDCDPANYDPTEGLEKPMFDPLTGAEESLLLDPGLIQGPDITLRQSGLADDTRRDRMTNQVLVDQVTNPSQLVGIMSSGHREAARLNQPKIDQLKAFHSLGEPSNWLGKAWNDPSDPQTNLNAGVIPNYSPTSFFIMTNSDAVNESGEKLMKYIGTIAFAAP